VELTDEDRESPDFAFSDAVPEDRLSPFADRVRQDFSKAGFSQTQADVFTRIIEANANVWARETART
jgi:hypothetical protein